MLVILLRDQEYQVEGGSFDACATSRSDNFTATSDNSGVRHQFETRSCRIASRAAK